MSFIGTSDDEDAKLNFFRAEKFFYQAMSLAPLDVFVLHEMGVIKYESEAFEDAEEIFRTTLGMVTDICKKNNEPLSDRWEPLLNNLGHCCRKNKKLSESLSFHTRALSLKPLSSETYTAIGFVQSLMGRLNEAVESFHKSLSLKRDDVITSTILKTVLEDLVDEMVEDDGIATSAPPANELNTSEVIAMTIEEPNRMRLFPDNESDLSDMNFD